MRFGWVRFVVSHPKRKNKDALRVGTPVRDQVTLQRTTTRTTADPLLRSGKQCVLGGWVRGIPP